MTIEFQYGTELAAFLQLFLLGMVLSTVVMYITEAVKKWLSGLKLFAKYSWGISLVCFVISMGFGVAWRAGFAADTIDALGGVWLGILLYLGSTGLYQKLENSNGFWGRTVTSYKKMTNDFSVADLSVSKEEEKLSGEQKPQS